MSGKLKGVQAITMEVQSLALYTHCANHRLNLAIIKACTVANIRNAVGVISSLANCFRESSRQLHVLDLGRKDILKTRWIERYDSVLTFLEPLYVLPSALQTIAQTSSKGSNAFALLRCILSSEIIVCVVVLGDILGITLPLARKLQAEYMGVFKAMKLVNATISSIQELRDNSNDKFKTLFTKCEELAHDLGTNIKKPRVEKLQKNRDRMWKHSLRKNIIESVFTYHS